MSRRTEAQVKGRVGQRGRSNYGEYTATLYSTRSFKMGRMFSTVVNFCPTTTEAAARRCLPGVKARLRRIYWDRLTLVEDIGSISL